MREEKASPSLSMNTLPLKTGKLCCPLNKAPSAEF